MDKRLITAILLSLLFGLTEAGDVTTDGMGKFSQQELASFRESILQGIRSEQEAGALPHQSSEATRRGVDEIVSQLASIQSISVRKGTFLGLTIGDPQSEVLAKLRALGANSVFASNPYYGTVSAVSDLPHLYGYSDFIMSPSFIEVVLDGDKVIRVIIPPVGAESPYRAAIQHATSRSEVFEVFRDFLLRGPGAPTIERVLPEPKRVEIRGRDTLADPDLTSNPMWHSEFNDAAHRRVQLDLLFDSDGKLTSFGVISSAGAGKT